MTHYLRFPDEATAITVLADYRTEDDTWITASHAHALDVIGTITIGGEYDEEGNVVTAPTVLDGWHVNFVGELPESWANYVVTPEQPVRVFAA
jgi:hypothetical protein